MPRVRYKNKAQYQLKEVADGLRRWVKIKTAATNVRTQNMWSNPDTRGKRIANGRALAREFIENNNFVSQVDNDAKLLIAHPNAKGRARLQLQTINPMFTLPNFDKPRETSDMFLYDHPSLPISVFLRKKFSQNEDVLADLQSKTVRDLLSDDDKLEAFHRRFLLVDPIISKKSDLRFETEDESIRVYGRLLDNDGNLLTENLSRHLYPDNTVNHESFTLQTNSRKRGLGRKVVSSHLDLWRDLGKSKVDLYAAWDGTVVWAKMGFIPDRPLKSEDYAQGIFETIMPQGAFKARASQSFNNQDEAHRRLIRSAKKALLTRYSAPEVGEIMQKHGQYFRDYRGRSDTLNAALGRFSADLFDSTSPTRDQDLVRGLKLQELEREHSNFDIVESPQASLIGDAIDFTRQYRSHIDTSFVKLAERAYDYGLQDAPHMSFDLTKPKKGV